MDEAPVKRSSRRMWWIAGGSVAGVVLVAAAIWFLVGPKVWTDGGAIRVSDRDTKIRDVIWTRPKALEGFSSDEQVYEPSVSPDGTELYFVRGKAGGHAKIYVSYRRNNAWTSPELVKAIDGPFDSLGPRVTPDGQFLLFYSDRPGGFGGYDIWASPRTDRGWGKPFNLGPHVNSEFNEFNPDPTPDGRHLIFATNRMAARREQNEAWRSTIRETVSSDYDLWIADADSVAPEPATQPAATQPASSPTPLAFRPAREILGINTPYTEGASCMSPAGDFLYFSSNRPGGLGKFDIYRCRVHGDQFLSPENVGMPINSSENEADPALAYNGFRMIFSSDRAGADGRYHLLVADSREVYPERQARPLPHLGWSWWLLIISALVLIPLLMYLRGWEDHRLSIIQRCLLLSLLVHALITFILSFVVVTQKVTQYVRHEIQLDVAVNLAENQGVEESLAVRGQVSGDLPVSAAAPPSLAPSRQASEVLATSTLEDVKVPGAQIAPGGMTIPVESPRLSSPSPTKTAAQVTATTPFAAMKDLPLPSSQALSQAEASPQAQTIKQASQKAAATDIPFAVPVEISSRAVVAVAPQINSAARAPDVRTARGSVSDLATNVRVEADPEPAGPQIAGPQVAASRLGGSETTPRSQSSPGPGLAKASITTEVNGATGSDLKLNDTAPPANLTVGALSAAAPANPGRSMLSGGNAKQASPSVDAGVAQGPSIKLTSTMGRQTAQEPDVQVASASSNAGIANAPLHRDEQAAATGPMAIDASAGPTGVKASSTGSSLKLPPVGTATQRVGAAIAAGPVASPRTEADANASQIASRAAPAAGAHAQSTEPSLTAAEATRGPSRPVEIAEARGAEAAPGAIQLAGSLAGKPSTQPATELAIGVPHRGDVSQSALASNVTAVNANSSIDELRDLSTAAPPVQSKVAGRATDRTLETATAGAALSPHRMSDSDVGTAVGQVIAGDRKVPTIAASNASLASPVAHRAVPVSSTAIKGQGAPAAVASAIGNPPISGPNMTFPDEASRAASTEKTIATDGGFAVGQRPSRTGADDVVHGDVNLASAPLAARASVSTDSLLDSQPQNARPQRLDASVASIQPDQTPASLDGPLGPAGGAVPDLKFIRAPEQRKPLIEHFGGTKESEDAVARGLAYLARMQEPDGRWTRVDDDEAPGNRPHHPHDMACTGFALLAFLGQDNTPDRPGPYRDVVRAAVDYMISQQDEDGDLRGQRHFRAGGADSANMYDQGIATYALAECAILTHDPRTIQAALKAAQFIVKAQDRRSGGWRYSPREYGDSSVFGWQIMALHSAQQVGFEIPPETIDGAERYIESCAEGRQGLLAGYQPHTGPTPAMTAELLFSRMLLDMPLDDEGVHEATRFLARDPPDMRNADLYYWYYASLSMLHMQNPLWKDWNVLTRESLIRMQQTDGPSAGCWDTNMRWGERGGRIFTTAMATLTLEVYYRYLPLRKAGPAQPAAER